MFGKIAAFELRYQIRQPIFWIAGLIFFLLVFASVTIDQIQIGSGGNVHKNSPQAIAETVFVMSVFFMFVATAFVANIVVRDDETGYGPIIRSTPIRKFDYLFGRFAGAYLATALSFLFVPLGILVGSVMPWVDPETLGPNNPAYYAYAYFLIGLPSLLLVSAIFFALATATRSMMATYVGVAAFLVLYIVMNAALRDPERRQIAALVEPFGFAAFELATRYFTAAESNTTLPAFEGPLLYNRLIWLGVAVVFLVVAYAVFRFETKGRKARRMEKLRAAAEAEAPAAPAGPLPAPTYGAASAWAQLRKRTRFEMGQVFKSPAFVVLLLLGLFNSAGSLFLGAERGGTDIFPVTSWVIQTLNGAFTLVIIIIAIYYAGELVWRERDRRTNEIVDATAVPDWAFLVPKTLALALVLFATLAVSAVAGVIVQLSKGYTDIGLWQYLAWYIVPNAVDWTLLAVLAIFFQAVTPHKFIGWGLMLLYLIASITFGNIGLEHNLYNYGGSPAVPLSDMNGQGDYWKAAAWFRAYWSAFAIVLLVLSYGLWRRGTETRLLPRLKRLPRRLAGPAGVVGAVAIAAFAGLGGWIFLNTNVWNEYRTALEQEKWQADYEKAFLKYETLPQPSLTDVVLNLDLDPGAPRLVTKGRYALVNDSGGPIRDIHIRLDRDTRAEQLTLSAPAKMQAFDRFNYRIFTLDQPLQPGQTATLEFTTVMQQRGFKNRGNTTRLVDNGTFVNNFEFAPIVGMDRQQTLRDRAKRRKYGLPPELRPARLEDRSAQARNYLANADWVNADITVTTVADQTPVAPGYKVSDVTTGDRRTVRYRTDAPVLNFFSVQSARYAIRKVDHKGVELAIYYDAQHPYNVDRMLKALEVGLDYFQAEFSPYQFRQARILEFPGYATFAQAFANTMPYSEAIGFIADNRDKEKIDYVTYVTAHELGHQWWAHQVIGADMQGATVLSETLASYSALKVMEKIHGPDGIRRFLKRELDTYLRSRGGEVVEELPLIRVEDQGYIHYQKGGIVMYLLADRIGEAKVNAALRQILQQYAFKGAPYPRSQDLVDALRSQAGSDPVAQQLITDLFEKITVYDLKTKTAEAAQRPDGRWDVTLTLEARKMYADGQGKETPASLSGQLFDVGVFTAEPGKAGFSSRDVAYFRLTPLQDGVQTVRVIVDRKPVFAGIDPYNKQIDRNSDDNAIRVTGG
ncbi:ABC transporter permease subunit [Phenylobacterium sp. J426]|uniref:ABC transporter permease/M1 family aminopeptidase n=1 Tax=Phenylobacterium sp. J426 TaxID=2898439 RepID=UPI002151CB55|nr:ABC transporter permease subunit [Phenylobacterium sp. J426]MCR5875191.1 ABC transporter permease subunit [Phenylobacterium sp. J426]